MNKYIKNGLNVIAYTAAFAVGTYIGCSIQTRSEKMVKHFDNQREKYAESKWKAIEARDSLKIALGRYEAAKQEGTNNRGLYIVNLGPENNYEARSYSKEGLDRIMDETTRNLKLIQGEVEIDSTKLEDYKIISEAIQLWIKHPQ